MGELRMPSLGADMEAGRLVEWRVAAGSAVERGDIVAVVETQKGLIEIEIWESGVVEALLVEPGAEVPVGTPLARVRSSGAEAPGVPPAPPAAVPPPPAPPAAAPAPPAPPAVQAPVGAVGATGRVLASPAARQLGRELSIDLHTVRGTGPHGAITRGDVERARPAPSPSPAPATPAPIRPPADLSGMRRAIAAAMERSKREIPHYYLSLEIDLSPATAWLEAENAQRPVTERMLMAALLLRATALAAREVPEVNGWYVDGAFRPSAAVHVGVAVALRGGGLVAPAIHDAADKPVTQLMAELRELVARVRAGTMRASELADPTLTVTNLGDQGVDSVLGVVYPPQVAIVGFGRPVERPWAERGMLGVRRVITATLSADHRASDGHRGARFLASIARRLAHPEEP